MISDEDKALFRQAVLATRPLKKNPGIPASESRPAPRNKTGQPRPGPETADHKVVQEQELYLSSYYPEEVQSHCVLSYSGHQIPPKRMRELRQGQIRWEARLDLHGFRPDDAQRVLLSFIRQHMAQHHRCLLIIHGKGSLNGEAPVLKNLVNHWLPQIPQVLAFHSAHPRDGGTGAMYVLLKRNRG